MNITSSFVDKVKLASQSAITSVNKTTKAASEMSQRVVKGNQEEIQRQKAKRDLKLQREQLRVKELGDRKERKINNFLKSFSK
jgi:hypothetical protein